MPDGLAILLQLLMLSGEVHRVQAEVTDPPRPAPGGMWLKWGGIIIPCHYILYGQSKNKHGVRKHIRLCHKNDTCKEPSSKKRRVEQE